MDDPIGDDVGPSNTAEPPTPWLSPAHFWSAVLLVGLPTAFTMWVGFHDPSDRHNLGYALGGIAGPYAAVIVSDDPSRCLTFSNRLALLFCGPALAYALAIQLPSSLRQTASGRSERMRAWMVGWVSWCLGAVASYLHGFG